MIRKSVDGSTTARGSDWETTGQGNSEWMIDGCDDGGTTSGGDGRGTDGGNVGNPVLALILDIENLQPAPILTAVDVVLIVGIPQRRRRIKFLP